MPAFLRIARMRQHDPQCRVEDFITGRGGVTDDEAARLARTSLPRQVHPPHHGELDQVRAAQPWIQLVPNGPGFSSPRNPFPILRGNVAPPAPQISGPLPRRADETAYASYALRRRWAPDQCDCAVSSISVLDATGSSAASASI